MRPSLRRNRNGGVLRYVGPAYIRPADRGILLQDLDGGGPDFYLDSLVEQIVGGYGDVEIEVFVRARRKVPA